MNACGNLRLSVKCILEGVSWRKARPHPKEREREVCTQFYQALCRVWCVARRGEKLNCVQCRSRARSAPVPGAETSALPKLSDNAETVGRSNVAAPEDGRTPFQDSKRRKTSGDSILAGGESWGEGGPCSIPPDTARNYILLCLSAIFSALVGSSFAATAVSENDFKGAGICQFATHGFVLAPTTEKAINDSVRQLLERHRTVLRFTPRFDFRLRMRMYGRFADYTNAVFNLYWTNAADRLALQGRPFNVAGFYTSKTKEIVTWRQQVPGFLGTTLLHEASHAIMDAHYEDVPMWMMEGAADYFAFALHPPGELHQLVLRQRWTKLHGWLHGKNLLPLETLLNADSATFKGLDPEKAYITSWSLFQLMMSSQVNQQMMLRILHERQGRGGEPIDCAGQIERLHKGGLKRLDVDWRVWIVAGASATNAPARRPSTRTTR